MDELVNQCGFCFCSFTAEYQLLISEARLQSHYRILSAIHITSIMAYRVLEVNVSLTSGLIMCANISLRLSPQYLYCTFIVYNRNSTQQVHIALLCIIAIDGRFAPRDCSERTVPAFTSLFSPTLVFLSLSLLRDSCTVCPTRNSQSPSRNTRGHVPRSHSDQHISIGRTRTYPFSNNNDLTPK